MDKIKVNIDNFIRTNLISDYPEMSNQRLSRFWDKKDELPMGEAIPVGFSVVFSKPTNRSQSRDWQNF
jgi:hypothetical protein